MKNNTILITGVAGLLGSHTAKNFINKGYKVIGIDNLSGGYIENICKNVIFYKFDLNNNKSLESVFKKHKIDYIYHFAAYAAVGLSPFIRNFNYKNNVIASVNLINFSIKYKIKKFIFASSMDVYGNQSVPFYEEMNPKPEDPYGIAKFTVEMDLKNAKNQFNLNYTIIRPHNVIGPNQNIWDKYRNVVGIWIRKTLEKKPITIYGSGNQKRAFSDVKYYLDPFEKLMFCKESDNNIINMGSDNPISLNHLSEVFIDVITKKINRKINVEYLEKREEVEYMWCNHDKAKNIFGDFDKTNISSLIEETWDWACSVKPKKVKNMNLEITDGIYEFWKN